MQPSFNNILDPKEFDELSTSQKIKLCVDKKIFIISNVDPFTKKTVLLNHHVIDLSAYNDEKFRFLECYKSENFIAFINYDLIEEIFLEVCRQSETSLSFFKIISDLKFNLETYTTVREKLNFLNQTLQGLDLFKLKDIDIWFDWEKNELDLSVEQPVELINNNEDIIYDWLTSSYIYISKYNKIQSFIDGYHKYLLAKECYNEIKDLQNSTKEEREEIAYMESNPGKLTAYQQAYFLSRMGLYKKMRDAKLSEVRIAKITSMVINRNYDNTRKDIRSIFKDFDKIGKSEQRARKEVDDIITSFTNLG
ncbi:MAG: hypothetical protein CMC08_03120 [Flavobacteriaceae bacterium]|nr:hypothetical protein [Flavobacteriaceae bacterium]